MQLTNENCCVPGSDISIEVDAPDSSSPNQIVQKDFPETSRHLKTEALSMLLMKLRITPNHNGFKYLLSAIEFSLTYGDQHLCVTKDIYPYVAKKCNSTPGRVERCMRKSIDYAWKNNGSEFFETMAGFKMSKKPTNSQFISFSAEYIKSRKNEFYE